MTLITLVTLTPIPSLRKGWIRGLPPKSILIDQVPEPTQILVKPVSGLSLMRSLMVIQCIRASTVEDFLGMDCLILRSMDNQDKLAGLERRLIP